MKIIKPSVELITDKSNLSIYHKDNFLVDQYDVSSINSYGRSLGKVFENNPGVIIKEGRGGPFRTQYITIPLDYYNSSFPDRFKGKRNTEPTKFHEERMTLKLIFPYYLLSCFITDLTLNNRGFETEMINMGKTIDENDLELEFVFDDEGIEAGEELIKQLKEIELYFLKQIAEGKRLNEVLINIPWNNLAGTAYITSPYDNWAKFIMHDNKKYNLIIKRLRDYFVGK